MGRTVPRLGSDAFVRTARVLERARAAPSWVVPKVRVTLALEYVASAIAHAEESGCPVSADAEAVVSEFPVQACGVIDLFRAAMAHLVGDRGEAIRLLERQKANRDWSVRGSSPRALATLEDACSEVH